MTLSDLAKRQIRPRGNRKRFGPEGRRNRENSSISTEAWSTHGILSGSSELHYDSDDKNTLTKNTFFVDSEFAGDPVSKKKKRRRNLSHWEPHSDFWIHTRGLAALRERSSGVLRQCEKRSSWTILEIYIRGPRNSNVS